MKKIITLLITLTMVMSMAVPAFAADADVSAPASVKLTSSQVKAITPKGVKASTYSYTKIKVTWNKIEGVDGYKVYRATSKGGKYTVSKTTTSADTLSYINTGRTTGKTYYYKIRGYKKIGRTTYYTKYSAVTSTYARPNKVVITKVTCPKENCVRLYWNKVDGATGYQIYKRKKGTTTWKNTDYKNDKFSWKYSTKYNYATHMLTTFATSGDSAYSKWEYKVRAYRTVNGKRVYGYFSAPKEYVPDWTIDEIYEELWKYGESLAWTEYEYIEGKPNPDEWNGRELWPTDRKYHFKHCTGAYTFDGGENWYGVFTNPEHGPTTAPAGSTYESDTPENSSWDVIWPERISYYDTKSSILKRLKPLIQSELETLHRVDPIYWDPLWEVYSGVQDFKIYLKSNKNSYQLWLLY